VNLNCNARPFNYSSRITALSSEVNKISRENGVLQEALSEAESKLAAQQQDHSNMLTEWTGKVQTLEGRQRAAESLRREMREVKEQESALRHEVGVLTGKVQSLRLELQHKDGECASLKNKLEVC